MEVVEVALGFQITLSLLRHTAEKPGSTVMWIVESVSNHSLDLSLKSPVL